MALERQMQPTIAEIDQKHVARYAWASQFMVGRRILDAACGCGYGSSLLSVVASNVRGVDYSEEAIAFALLHYLHGNTNYMVWDMNADSFPFAGLQGIVSLETIEHLDRPVEETLEFYHKAMTPGGIVCLSHPINETEGRNPFHKQFWIDDVKLIEAAKKIGFALVESKRQPGCKLYDYHLLALRKA